MAEAFERLAEARTAVEQSCQLLLTPFPDVMDRSSGLLAHALATVSAERVRILQQPPNSNLLAEFRLLQSKIHLAGQLLETAASYYNGWDRVLRSMVAGYSSSGAAASLSRGGRLAVSG
jgi:hypothetical protein